MAVCHYLVSWHVENGQRALLRSDRNVKSFGTNLKDVVNKELTQMAVWDEELAASLVLNMVGQLQVIFSVDMSCCFRSSRATTLHFGVPFVRYKKWT